MKNTRRFFILALVLTLILALLPAAAMAAGGEAVTVSGFAGPQVNPEYEDVLTVDDLLTYEEALAAQEQGLREQYGPFWHFVPQLRSSGTGTVYSNKEAAAAALRPQLAARKALFTISFWNDKAINDSTVRSVFTEFLYSYGFRHTGDPKYGDVLNRHLGGWGGYRYECYGPVNGRYRITFRDVPLTWYTNADQERYVDDAVAGLVSQLDLHSSYYSDYDKVKAIYDWITAHIKYDDEHVDDPDYDLQYTIYAALRNGTCVCQGYAQLFYRLALEAGVDARYISGRGYGNGGWENHGWNIAKLDGRYYLLDSTWDAQLTQGGSASYKYFLQPLSVFSSDHAVVTDYPYRTWYWSDYSGRLGTEVYDPAPADVPYLTAVYAGWSSANGPSVYLSWGRSSGASRYLLQYSTDGGSTWRWDDEKCYEFGSGTLSYTHSGLANGADYRYRIWALNGMVPCSYYTYSSTVSIGPLPGTVNGLTAVQNGAAVDLTWQPVSDAQTLWLERRIIGNAWETVSASVTGSSYRDKGVQAGNTYVYRLRGVNDYGRGEAALSAAVRVLPAPGAVKTLTAALGTGGISVKWSAAPNSTYYMLQRQVNGGSWKTLATALKATNYADQDVSLGNTYAYRVRGRNSVGFGAYKAGSPALYQIPGAISSLTATVGEGSLTVSWSPSSNADRYLLQRKTEGGSWTTLATALSGTTYRDGAVEHGSAYVYRVRGRNSGLNGAFKTGEAITALGGKPGSVASVRTVGAAGRNTVSWAASSYATCYVLQRQRNNGAWETLKTNLAACSYVDTDVAAGGTYRYRVRGRNALGYGEYKAGASVRIDALPKPGTIAKVSTGATAEKVTVKWSAASNGETYLLQRSVDGGTWTNVKSGLTARQYADTDVQPGSAYRYRVRAVNAAGSGPFQTGVSVRIPLQKPGAVAGISASWADGGMTVRWSIAANAPQYQLQRRVDGGSWTTLSSTLSETVFTDHDLTPGSAYQYRVRGRNLTVYGPYTAGPAVYAP